MADLPEPEFVSENTIPDIAMARAIVVYFKGIGFVGLASNVPSEFFEGAYETAEEAKAGAVRMSKRYVYGDSLDAYQRGRETKDWALMERARQHIQARLRG